MGIFSRPLSPKFKGFQALFPTKDTQTIRAAVRGAVIEEVKPTTIGPGAINL